MALTEKQKAFVQEYLVDLNATAAAKRAGYSEKNADKIGSELLGKTRVAEAIQKAMQSRQQRTQVTQDMVIQEISKVAFKDAADYSESELKYANKLKALEMLAKHLGLYAESASLPKDEIHEDGLSKSLKELAEELESDDIS